MNKWIVIDKQLHSGNPYEVDYSDYSILAEFAPQVSHSRLPTGLHTWMIYDENCNDTRKLKLSSVSTTYDQLILCGQNDSFLSIMFLV